MKHLFEMSNDEIMQMPQERLQGLIIENMKRFQLHKVECQRIALIIRQDLNYMAEESQNALVQAHKEEIICAGGFVAEASNHG